MKKRRISICYTCCDNCHLEHKNLLFARIHYQWIRLKVNFNRFLGLIND